MRTSLLIFTGAIALFAGCYDGEFDPDASGVFVCEADDDCPTGQICYDKVCVSDEGPALNIIGPEPFQRIQTDNAEQLAGFTVTIRGSDLMLSDSSQAVEGEGYISLLIDGTDVSGRIVAGDLAGGLTSGPYDLSGFEVGPHRLRVRAFHGDGKPYTNPSAATDGTFFRDDGTPQIAIVEPKPGHIQDVNNPMAVTLAAINWTWNSAGSTLADREGHTHTYSLSAYPGCLAADVASDAYCNYQYLVSISGQGIADNPILIQGEVSPDNLQLLPLGLQPFQAGLQDNEHEPFPDVDAPEYDEIPIELVAG